MDWIIHLDTDELLHPAGAKEYSLRQLLLDVPGNVDMVIFPNYVSELCIGNFKHSVGRLLKLIGHASLITFAYCLSFCPDACLLGNITNCDIFVE